jgi:hypothetical protein
MSLWQLASGWLTSNMVVESQHLIRKEKEKRGFRPSRLVCTSLFRSSVPASMKKVAHLIYSTDGRSVATIKKEKRDNGYCRPTRVLMCMVNVEMQSNLIFEPFRQT